MNQRINAIELDDLRHQLQRMTRQGRDLPEAMDRVGVILTPSRLDQIRADALDDLASMLEGSELAEWRGDMRIASPQDAKTAITARIRLLAKATRTRRQA